MPDHPQLDAPMTLTGLFPPDSSDDERDDEERNKDDESNSHQQGNSTIDYCYEIQSITLVGITFRIRQFDFHSHNANRVWPGTFHLAEYLLAVIEDAEKEGGDQQQPKTSDDATDASTQGGRGRRQPCCRHHWGHVLELGTATGLLAMRMAMACHQRRILQHELKDDTNVTCDDHNNNNNNENNNENNDDIEQSCCASITTSDVQDEHDDVARNLQFNYRLNSPGLGFDQDHLQDGLPGSFHASRIDHIPHTWGTGWSTSVERALLSGSTQSDSAQHGNDNRNNQPPWHFDTIIASDILLYANTYPALVQTLTELMFGNTSSCKTQLVMSWNRRMPASQEFFDRMQVAGFQYQHQGKCIYTFQARSVG